MKLNQLPQELSKQNDLLWLLGGTVTQTNNEESSREYLIEDLSVKVLVNMVLVKTQLPNPLPTRSQIYRCDDIASVTISPPNKKVEDVVKHHFKSQMMPQTVEGVVKPRFAEIVINGTKV